ncbi:hypothetical protein [Streptomyces sp. NPDC020607]|uniref:hypothetical protein n=1 Tax=Streptomyces sp. NPDC020607 TaxID=3365082 RepID=UPI0037A176A7
MMTTEGPMKRSDLSDLTRTRMEALGLSFRALADACIDPKHPEDGPLWKRGTLENLVKGRGIKAPTDAQLRALQAGLDCPLLAIQRAAAAQFFGLVSERWTDSEDVRLLLARIDELDEAGVAELDELAQIVLKRRARQSDGQG